MTDERISPSAQRSASCVPFVAFAGALALHLGSVALLGSFSPPAAPSFPALAAAFLPGRLDLVHPASTHDLTPFAGRWFVPFPPLPALLVLPLVAVVPGFSTVAFCAVLGAANVALVAALLDGLARRGWMALDRAAVFWLTVLF